MSEHKIETYGPNDEEVIFVMPEKWTSTVYDRDGSKTVYDQDGNQIEPKED